MAYNPEIEKRINEVVKDWPGITLKKMFGGIGFLLNGNMLTGVYKESLILRLNETDFEEIKNVRGFHFFDITGKAMKGWAMLDTAEMRKEDYLFWIEKARRFVLTLPAK
jgi:TfoX/Sxy family transcriptional regulator of competence genes